MRGHTNKQILFAKEYILNGCNGTESVMRAYNCKNRSTAGVMAHSLMKNPYVLSTMIGIAKKYKQGWAVSWLKHRLRELYGRYAVGQFRQL
ncbi:MAG: terminase small subunit [Candidatus Omnitrophota bacterium]